MQMQINPFDILKNAQNLQEKLGGIAVTGSSGGGMVEVTLNGRMEVLAVRISRDALGLQDQGMLEDLTGSAFTNAIEKIREAISREMGALAGSLGMFPGFGAPGAL